VIKTDSDLFEMPAYTGETSLAPGIQGLDDSSLPCSFCFPTETQLLNGSSAFRMFHQIKCYFFVILATVVVVVLIIYMSNGLGKKGG
jgi:hypothetical protein